MWHGRRAGEVSHVAHHEPQPLRLGERSVQHDVGVADGLRGDGSMQSGDVEHAAEILARLRDPVQQRISAPHAEVFEDAIRATRRRT